MGKDVQHQGVLKRKRQQKEQDSICLDDAANATSSIFYLWVLGDKGDYSYSIENRE